jgi:dipeptidyl-peptidase-4
MGLRNRMAILSETFSHDRFYKRVHAANVFIEEILEYTAIHGERINRINREADERVARSGFGFEQGVRFEMVPLDEPLNLLSYKYIPYRKAGGSTDFVRSSELVVIEGVANYNAFEAIETAIKPRAYVFPGEFIEIADKLRLHGIPVETLANHEVFEGQVYSVSAVEKTDFPLNGHQNSVLLGEYRRQQGEFGAGSFYVPMDHRLANLAFYLLEPRADDGLAFWNFFDDYLEGALEQYAEIDYPVFKVLQ